MEYSRIIEVRLPDLEEVWTPEKQKEGWANPEKQKEMWSTPEKLIG